MRPMKLTMSAFGPYAEVTVIDMAKLTEGGLYLITGDTGAGKTMIFDAIAYALYGEASGTGRKNDMLRSKYAEPSVETYVELEFLHKGEIYRLKRVYGKERIKRNGERVEEKSGDASLLYPDGRVVTKHKDVTAAVEELIGFDSARFRGTAMLAQGEFRDFLFADTQKRLEVLRKLFNTDIYLRFADEVKRECSAIEQEYRVAKSAVEQYISMAECGDTSEWRPALSEMQEKGTLYTETAAVFAGMIEEDDRAAESLAAEAEAADEELLRVQALLTKSERDRENEDRLVKGRGLLEGILSDIALIETRAAEIEGERETYEAKKDALRRMELQLPEYDRLCEAEHSHEEAVKQLGERNERLNGLCEKKVLAEEELKTIDDRLSSLSEGEKDEAEEEYRRVQTQKGETDDFLLRLRALEDKKKTLDDARESYRKAAEVSDEAAAVFSSMERAYFDGIAGILAETLAEGECCPVCGSTVHPSPAKRNEGVPDRGELERRRRETVQLSDKAKVLSERAGELNGAYTAELDNVLRCGAELFPEEEGDTERYRVLAEERSAELSGTLTALLKRLRQAEQEEAERTLLLDRKKRFTDLKTETEKKVEEEAIAVVRAESEAEAGRMRVADIVSRLEFDGKVKAEAAVRDHREWISDYEERREATESAQRNARLTKERYTARIEELQEQLKDSTADAYEDLSVEMQKRTEGRKALAQALGEVNARRERNRVAAEGVKRKKAELDVLDGRLSEVKAISDTANGTLKEKEKVTLETFAQMRLFDRIIRRAATRLMKLTDGQYELIRRRESGLRGKSGLDIDVVDHYNGSVRSVRSLSGGEAFKASLALALALSDETEAECGGVVIDAMFIDEGFGSLDEESLSQAVAMLASLSGGGRSIGIISHVAELRERIDRQLVVRKAQGRGSIIG